MNARLAVGWMGEVSKVEGGWLIRGPRYILRFGHTRGVIKFVWDRG